MSRLALHGSKSAIIVLLLLCARPSTGQETQFKQLNDQAVQLYHEGKLDEAARREMEAVSTGEAAYGPNDLRVGLALSNVGSIYSDQGRFVDAIEAYKRSLSIVEKAYGPNNRSLAIELNGLAIAYAGLERYAEAEPLYRRALQIDEAAEGPDSKQVAAVLLNLGGACKGQGRFTEAEQLYRRAIDIEERKAGKDSYSVADALNDLGGLLKEQGRYAEAEPFYQRSLVIRQKAPNPETREMATLLNNLAALYDDEGKLRGAELLYRRALAIDEKAIGPEHPDLAIDLNNLAELGDKEGRYGEAESLYARALAIREKAFGSESAPTGMSLSNLADVYKEQGKFAEAEPLFQRALAIEQKSLGPQHRNVATVANNLASLYSGRGRFAEAEPLFKSALAINEKVLGTEHPKVADDLNNLALLYENEGKSGEAEPLYKRVLEIDEKTLGTEHEKVATVLNNLGELYSNQGRYPEAEQMYQRALHIQENVLGADHPEIEATLSNIAVLYDTQGKYGEAEPYFQRAVDNLFRQFQYSFTYMTEKDRLSFLKDVEREFSAYFSFVYRNHKKDPKLNGAMYDLLLWEKGFVAASIAGLRQEIEASGDSDAIAMLRELAAKRTQIAALLTSEGNREISRRQIDQLQDEAAEIEKGLVARSAAFRQHRNLEHATWQQVRDRLKSGQAAVEFARFHYFENGWQDRWLYVALVVRPDMRDQPQFIDLGEAEALESAAGSQLQDSVAVRGVIADQAATIPGKEVYSLAWQPLEKALGNARRVYVAADGVLNQIPLRVIPTPGGRLLMERYDLRLVLSTKDLLRASTKHPSRTALLIGDPDFTLNVKQEQAALRTLGFPSAGADVDPRLPATYSVAHAGTALSRLPGTGEEVNAIAALMKGRGWKSTVYTREFALKSTVETTRSPLVLHLATHGFFKPTQRRSDAGNPSQSEDPMLRSGLYFAGANRTLGGESGHNPDNGVLTAMEAGNLNLDGTELVVLSACDTGRGEIEDGEGVFGLRRAFQEAGAQAILMSLWSVPDRETQELMRQFYSRWLRGVEIHKALKDAQMQIRASVKRDNGGRDLPYYWGAFVLVGR